MAGPVPDRIAHSAPPPQMPAKGIRSDQNAQRNGLKCVHEALVPRLCADRRRREIRPFGIVARKAKRHRNDCDALAIIERRLVQPEPGSQSVARRIGERAPALMNPSTRRLPCNQDPRFCICPNDGAGHMRRRGCRKPVSTDPARPYVGNQIIHAPQLGHWSCAAKRRLSHSSRPERTGSHTREGACNPLPDLQIPC